MTREQFLQSVRVDVGGCWQWTGAKSSNGYGRVGRGERAHRRAWKLWRGPIPTGLLVCHRCDVPTCVNPAHLFLGTSADNTQDAYRKGRMHQLPSSVGEDNHAAKLTADDVRAIRSDGRAAAAIAAAYGVSVDAIYDIRTGRTWHSVKSSGPEQGRAPLPLP